MKKFGIAATVVSGLAAAVIGLAAPAVAAPTVPAMQQTIDELQAQGYTVIVNRIGTAPLEQASVVAVRPGQTVLAHGQQPSRGWQRHLHDCHQQDGLFRRQVSRNARRGILLGAPPSCLGMLNA